jgi:hypothetical protein
VTILSRSCDDVAIVGLSRGVGIVGPRGRLFSEILVASQMIEELPNTKVRAKSGVNNKLSYVESKVVLLTSQKIRENSPPR